MEVIAQEVKSGLSAEARAKLQSPAAAAWKDQGWSFTCGENRSSLVLFLRDLLPPARRSLLLLTAS